MSILAATNLPPALTRNERATLEAYFARARARATARRRPHHVVWATALVPLVAMLAAIATHAAIG